MALSDVAAEFRERPVLTTLTLGSLLGAFVMVVLSIALIPVGIGPQARLGWGAIVAIGVAIVFVWNVAYPLWDRYAAPE